MEELRRSSPSISRPVGKVSVSFRSPPDKLWHSTPIKKKSSGAPLDASQACVPTGSEVDIVARRWTSLVLTDNSRPPNIQENNKSINSIVATLSTQAVSLQVREEELSSMLKQKDQDVTKTSSHIINLTGSLPGQQSSLTESHSQERKLLRELKQSKQRYRDAKHEIIRLKEELQQQVTQRSAHGEQMIHLKQMHEQLEQVVVLLVEGDTWKDELLQMAHVKQKHIKCELHRIRQLLHVTVENACESLMKESIQEILGSEVSVLESLDCMWTDVEEKLSCRQDMSKNSKHKLNDAPCSPRASQEQRGGYVCVHSPEATNVMLTVSELNFSPATASTLPLGLNSDDLHGRPKSSMTSTK